MKNRSIIIGDVHGCIIELEDLLAKIAFNQKKDVLYFTGDIINRGWYSKEVYHKVKQLEATVILGNHELRLINEDRGILKPKERTLKLREEFGEGFKSFMEDIKTWPLFVDSEDFTLVHGGIIPGVALKDSDPGMMTRIRTWDGTGKDIANPSNPPWFDFYHKEKLAVFGHWAALQGIVRDNVIGLDTGCVYGKKLSALILPQREIVSTPAREVYCPIKNSVLTQNN
ncbi:MAG: metallophosphoesterase [Deltaproteobacteria bacterium]|nr:metallophosphoesterase [Deltaproteobacteria bacterium]